MGSMLSCFLEVECFLLNLKFFSKCNIFLLMWYKTKGQGKGIKNKWHKAKERCLGWRSVVVVAVWGTFHSLWKHLWVLSPGSPASSHGPNTCGWGLGLTGDSKLTRSCESENEWMVVCFRVCCPCDGLATCPGWTPSLMDGWMFWFLDIKLKLRIFVST